MAMPGFPGLLGGQAITSVSQEFRLLRQHLQALFTRLLHGHVQIGVLGFTECIPVPDDLA